ncbi:MAG: ABC transporter substrate-binding protein [Lachnospiraceae bacterium]|nr:ABC transporter substrate-binding protein [Lachnospiraceae bacterium]
MVRKKLMALFTAALLLSSAALTGCGGASSGGAASSAGGGEAASAAADKAGSDTAGAASEAGADTAGAASEAAGAAETTGSGEAKHLNASIYWFGDSLDPAHDWDGWTTCRCGITENLVTINDKYELVPQLSDTWEQKDNKTWVMHIRDGVTFHNGKAVDGAAVKASFDRVIAENPDRAVDAKIDSITADGQTVTFVTTEPYGAFLAQITEPLWSVIDVDAGTDIASAPVGTGPFAVTDFEVNTVVELEKYADYWNGASAIDTVTVTLIEDDSTRGLALQSGEQDLIQRCTSTDLPTFQNDSNYTVLDTQGARIRILLINHKNEFLSDVNVRKAFASAIDYETLVSLLGDIVTIAGAPYPASAPYGYDSLDKQTFDLAAAKDLLKKAGYEDGDGNGYVEKDGKELKLEVAYSNADYTTTLEAVQSMVKEAGINLSLSMMDSVSEIESAGNFDLILTNWQALSTGDPQWFLDNLYRSDASNNCTGYASKDIDKMCNDLTLAFDQKDRQNIVIEAQKILLADCASVWLTGEKNFVLMNSKVKNVTGYPIDYYFLDNGITID